MKLRLLAAILAVAAVGLSGCGGADMSDPRQVVISMFGAMEKNDKAALTHLLDLAELMRQTQQDYALQADQARVFTSPEQVLDDLTGEGETKRIWFGMQRIINESEITGNNAAVEVTFVDKEASRGYRTRFGLHKVQGEWRIYSFKTVQD